MHTPTTQRVARLLALSLSVGCTVCAQESTGDPFMDAMVEDQRKAEAARKQAAERQAQQDGAAPVTADPTLNDQERQREADRETRLVNMADETRLVSEEEMKRELGEGSGMFGGDEQLVGKTVNSVRLQFTTAERTVPAARIMDVIQTRAGSKYSPMRVNTDLERLIERGYVHPDARVMATPRGNGVDLVFVVRTADVLGGVGFEGNTFFDQSDLRDKTKLASGRPLNDKELARARAEIIKAYQQAGFPDAQVTWRATPTARNEYKDVIFSIKEGARVHVVNIDFVGNKRFDSKQLRQLMVTKERDWFKPLSWITKNGRLDREQLDDDFQAIVRHYRNYGYLRAAVSKVEATSAPGGSRKNLGFKIYLNEGPLYRVRHVTFGPMKVYTPKELSPGLSMLDNDIYSLQKVTDDVDMIRSYYGAKGYADAEVNPDITEVGVDEKGVHLIDIRYNINEGNPYRVGRINLTGNTKTRSHVILRELPLKSGSNLNAVDLQTAKKRLDNLKYFDYVDISQASSPVPGYRDVDVTVHEQGTGQFQVGVRFSSIQNASVYVSTTQSNFDIAGFLTGSFVGGGQRLTVTGDLGFDYQSARIHLLEPWFLDTRLALGNEVFFSSSSYISDYYTQRNFGYSVTLNKALNDYHSINFEYRIENFRLRPESDAPPFFRDNMGSFVRSHFALGYTYDSRDAIITPRKGGHFRVTGGWSGPGSTVQTYSAAMEGSYYYNSFWDSIFSFNFAVESVDALDKNKTVPLFERCYLGGPNNLRGFKYHDVGGIDPALAGSESMGGLTSAFAQFEVSLPLVDSIRFATFLDVGFVNEKSFDFKANKFAADWGIGLRLNLPIGPIAVDYAMPIRSDNAVDNGGQFQFYVDAKY
ncbi:MAG: outer membrane protein assembly factor BamA [Akkermansia sp.]|nr:outer membrane protein assembly factor BamA [Akkermansia sp.]